MECLNFVRHGAQNLSFHEYTVCGWILKSGRFYGCEYGQHNDLAKSILKSSGIRPCDPEGYLENCGAIKTTFCQVNKKPTVCVSIYSKITNEQLKTIMKWSEMNGVDFNSIISTN